MRSGLLPGDNLKPLSPQDRHRSISLPIWMWQLALQQQQDVVRCPHLNLTHDACSRVQCQRTCRLCPVSKAADCSFT